MNYTLEEVLDHDYVWVNKMFETITRTELNKNLTELSMHGIDPKEISGIKRSFENQFKNVKESEKESKITLLKLQSMTGFKYGKKSRTKVINR